MEGKFFLRRQVSRDSWKRKGEPPSLELSKFNVVAADHEESITRGVSQIFKKYLPIYVQRIRSIICS